MLRYKYKIASAPADREFTWKQVQLWFPKLSLPVEEQVTKETMLKHGITRIQPKPPTPSPEPTLDELKERKLNEFKRRRFQDENGLIYLEIGTFDADTTSRERIRNAVLNMTASETRNWTLADGSVITVKKADLNSVLIACAERSDELHAKYTGLKARVEACTTKEELDAIHWDEVQDASDAVPDNGEAQE